MIEVLGQECPSYGATEVVEPDASAFRLMFLDKLFVLAG